MPWRQEEEDVRVQCYPAGKSTAVRVAGFVLVGAGLLVVVLCVPEWAWLMILGAALILLGVVLIRK